MARRSREGVTVISACVNRTVHHPSGAGRAVSMVRGWPTRQRGPAAGESGQDPGAFDGCESQPCSGGFRTGEHLFILIGSRGSRPPRFGLGSPQCRPTGLTPSCGQAAHIREDMSYRTGRADRSQQGTTGRGWRRPIPVREIVVGAQPSIMLTCSGPLRQGHHPQQQPRLPLWGARPDPRSSLVTMPLENVAHNDRWMHLHRCFLRVVALAMVWSPCPCLACRAWPRPR